VQPARGRDVRPGTPEPRAGLPPSRRARAWPSLIGLPTEAAVRSAIPLGGIPETGVDTPHEERRSF